MKFQHDPSFQPIKRWGCYFISLGKIAEDITGKVLSDEMVMRAYADALNAGAMKWNCFILKPQTVLFLFLYELGERNHKAYYIGWWNKDSRQGSPEMFGRWHSSDATHEVLRYKYGSGYHFRLMDFDPYPEFGVSEITGRRLLRVELAVSVAA